MLFFHCVPVWAWPPISSPARARAWLSGKRTFTQQQPGASDTLLGAVGGVAYANGILFVGGFQPHRPDTGEQPGPRVSHAGLSGPSRSDSAVHRALRGVRRASQRGAGPAGFHQQHLPYCRRPACGLPTAVATDGTILAVADTANNRVMIWKSIPTRTISRRTSNWASPISTRFCRDRSRWWTTRACAAPQGVWIQNGKLFVADTQNHRVLIWNSIPTQNRQPADVVLGQANFNVAVQPDLTKATHRSRTPTRC